MPFGALRAEMSKQQIAKPIQQNYPAHKSAKTDQISKSNPAKTDQNQQISKRKTHSTQSATNHQLSKTQNQIANAATDSGVATPSSCIKT